MPLTFLPREALLTLIMFNAYGRAIVLSCQFDCTINSVALCFQQIVPPVLSSFQDQDSRVRYYACEALYNIAKVNLYFTDGTLIVCLLYTNQISICRL